jgi:hypothetical protein
VMRALAAIGLSLFALFLVVGVIATILGVR